MKAKLLLLFAASIIFFVFLEITIRIVSPQHGKGAERFADLPKGSLVSDDKFGVRLKPNFEGTVEKPEFKMAFATNSKGIRDKEYGPKEEGIYRIFCLGDSMTFGYGVNEEYTFARLLAKGLSGPASAKIEVINGGMPGYDVDRYGLVFNEIGLKYKPDLLIIFFTISNDFGEEIGKGEGPAIKNKYTFSIRDIKKFLSRHSHLYAWVKQRLNSMSLLNMALIKMGVREIGDIYLTKYPKIMQLKVERAETIFEQIYNTARLNGCDVIVVSIPDSRQLSKNLRFNSYYWDMNRPNKVLKEIFNKTGIRYLDLLPIFKEEGAEMLYYRKDGHLNKDGHSEVARLVAEYLIDSKLIH